MPNVNRIVGGSRVRTNKYPWIAQMLRDSVQICGATLINDRYALTAAHCVHNMNLNHISIRLLQLDKNSANEGILRRVVFVNMHEQYNPATLEHDIALLKLDEPVPLLNPIRPVCLPNEPNQNFDFHKGIVAGWGLTSENGAPSTYLRELVVPVLTNAQCRATSYRSMILSTMLCAGYLEGGKDSCQVWKQSWRRLAINTLNCEDIFRGIVVAPWLYVRASIAWLVLYPLAMAVPMPTLPVFIQE